MAAIRINCPRCGKALGFKAEPAPGKLVYCTGGEGHTFPYVPSQAIPVPAVPVPAIPVPALPPPPAPVMPPPVPRARAAAEIPQTVDAPSALAFPLAITT